VELGSQLYAPESHVWNTGADSGDRFRPWAIPAAGITRSSGLRGFKKERQMASKTTNPFTFLQQVRSETAKVTWPSRRETMISTVMVLAFAFIAAIFFFAADQVMAYGVELILGIGR
jgi:preprotein translocase subunit SecE